MVEPYSTESPIPAGFADVEFDIELIGANRFFLADQDWACDEIWEPTQRRLKVSLDFACYIRTINTLFE